MISSKRPAGDLFVLLHVFPGLSLTAGTDQGWHAPFVLAVELERPHRDINDLFVDQRLFAADRTAVEVFLRRWPKGAVDPFVGWGLVRVVVHIDLV